MYRGQTGISHWRNITHNIRNVQGTDFIIHINGNFTSGHYTQTHGHSQIVAYWAATFAAKNTLFTLFDTEFLKLPKIHFLYHTSKTFLSPLIFPHGCIIKSCHWWIFSSKKSYFPTPCKVTGFEKTVHKPIFFVTSKIFIIPPCMLPSGWLRFSVSRNV